MNHFTGMTDHHLFRNLICGWSCRYQEMLLVSRRTVLEHILKLRYVQGMLALIVSLSSRHTASMLYPSRMINIVSVGNLTFSLSCHAQCNFSGLKALYSSFKGCQECSWFPGLGCSCSRRCFWNANTGALIKLNHLYPFAGQCFFSYNKSLNVLCLFTTY